jgi:hypothetical protein
MMPNPKAYLIVFYLLELLVKERKPRGQIVGKGRSMDVRQFYGLSLVLLGMLSCGIHGCFDVENLHIM